MPRNSAGIYTLPDPPRVPDTTIESADENTTRDDIAAELTNSLDRNGRGGMLAPFRIADGVLGAPGLAFTNEPSSGLFRSAPNTWSLVAGGVKVAELTPTSFTVLVGGATEPVPGEFTTLNVSGAGTINGPLTVGGTGTFTGRIFANGGITIGAGQTLTGLAALSLTGAFSAGSAAISGGLNVTGGATIGGPVTVGSLNSSGTLPLTINGAERARLTASGYFKASPNGTYFAPSLNYHEFIQSASDYIIGFGNSGGNPGGAIVAYSQAPNNSNQFNSFLQCIDNAATTLRFDIMSNGGARGYLSNNVALSDRKVKTAIHTLTPDEIAALWVGHRDMPWCAFKFVDQTHNDPNIGYLAEDIAAHFQHIAPWLVEDMTVAQGTFSFVYENDLLNIAHTLLSECQRRIERLEQSEPPQ